MSNKSGLKKMIGVCLTLIFSIDSTFWIKLE